ncbi:MAG: hypothetical protein ACK4PR_06555 [Gammaproteobacteria bacterium]
MNKKNKTHMIMLRVTDEQADELSRLAKLGEKKVTAVVRDMIDFGIKNAHRPKVSRVDKTHLQASFESLYILRSLANRVDDGLAENALKDAKQTIERYFEVVP